MEDKFYNDDFEEFLRQEVKNSRMYPSDGLWRIIYKQMHGDTNWPALTIAAFVFMAAIIAISFYFSPSAGSYKDFTGSTLHASPSPLTKKDIKPGDLVAASGLENTDKPQSIPFVESKDDNVRTLSKKYDNDDSKTLTFTRGDKQISLQENTPASSGNFKVDVPAGVSSLSLHTASSPALLQIYLKETNFRQVPASVLNYEEEKQGANISMPENATGLLLANDSITEIANANFQEDYLKRPVKEPSELSLLKGMPKKKFSYTVHIAASNSYRKLVESNILRDAGKPGPVALHNLVDVNKVVRYKPGNGIEAGISFFYNITEKLKVKTGLQFNVRQYSVAAYMTTTEVATIGLINRSGGLDSVAGYATYRNTNGYMPAELMNRYYQVSLPIGLEWQVAGNRNIQLHVAANVQPTYFLNRNAYLISTDYNNYTQNADLIRKWNVNTTLEAFVSLKSGDFRWQFGPQFRYQNLSTYIKAYPIREYLIDYGLKLGVSKVIH